MAQGARPTKAKVEARSAVTRKSRKLDASTSLQLKQRLAEALEQHAAISAILKVISASPSDVQPVLDTVAESATRLCGSSDAEVFRRDGDRLRLIAHYGTIPSGPLGEFTVPLVRDSVNGRATLNGQTIHVVDVQAKPHEFPVTAEFARRQGSRTQLIVPMLRHGVAIGTISLRRTVVDPFTERQIALLTTFAAQAVIAIENVRLFNETKEALEQQTATSEILRVISRSQTDVQPVFDTIAAAALKLCGASAANVFTFDGHLVRLASLVSAHPSPEYAENFRKRWPMPPGRRAAATRAILTCGVVEIPDVLEDSDYAVTTELLAGGFRSVLSVPLMRDRAPIGAISVGRTIAGLFPAAQVALLQTFADQAVIAIENVRLFNETKEALEQQTATSEILRVISRSQTDVQPVFDTIAAAALKLCRATSAVVGMVDGDLVRIAASANISEETTQTMQRNYPRKRGRDTATVRAIETRAVVTIPDVLADPEYDVAHALKEFRSALGVPLLRGGEPIGAIGVGRAEIGDYTAKEIALLQTFADQAVIAIENVRLFTELEARTAQLTRSVGELRALGDVGQAVSSTLDLETVLSTIVARATQLTGMDGGSIYEYDEEREEFHLHTTDRLPPELVEAARATPIRKGEGALGRMAMTGEPVQIPDIIDEAMYQSRVREILVRLGYRSLLAVPLLRDNHLLGGLAVNRKRAGEFDAEIIALLKTFASQSALAIQNARLFREIEIKSRELETASRHKSEFLANMSHELRTPLNAIIGFSEVLSEKMFGEINEKQAEYIGDILESGHHLLSLINDILDLSKIEAGRMDLERSDFDLPSTIENTLTLVRERALRRGIELCRSVDERLGVVRADERKVKQVLLNLLSNALKFTPEGGRINVRAAVRDSTAEISVTDTGVGIAPEDQDTVFEEFRQVGTAAKTVEGTGLGLAISRERCTGQAR